ncbi:hypothetical protein BT69DRAFT_48912 [Atractiella rhizophila]|nr:hypothetical protein BT69DRAFT_48912 [Atractiella rhizophila]
MLTCFANCSLQTTMLGSDQLMRLAHGTTIIPPPQSLRRTQIHTGLESSTPSPIPTPTLTPGTAATADMNPHVPLRKSVTPNSPTSLRSYVRTRRRRRSQRTEDMERDAADDVADGEEDGEGSADGDGRSKEANSAPLAPNGATLVADAKTLRGTSANVNGARAAKLESEARGFAGPLAVH